MYNQLGAKTQSNVSIRLSGRAGVSFVIGIMLAVFPAIGQNSTALPSGGLYTNGNLAFRYSTPNTMQDKTQRFQNKIQERAKAQGNTKQLSQLLAMSTGPDDKESSWGSLVIETHLRSTVSEPDDVKAAVQMNAWIAHSKDEIALPKSVVISGQRFTVSVFGLQEGAIRKGTVVFTTVRKDNLLSFAFAANSPELLKDLAESMKTLQFY